MPRENRGGGEPINGGEVDFDAVLAEVVNEVGDEAKKEQRAGLAGELGKRLKGISAKESGAEEELTATAFNTLVFSEFGNSKIPDGVKTKHEAYNSAKEKYGLSVKKMKKLPDSVQQDPRLANALSQLKSKMVARASGLASELGVNYEEIAKGEMSLLTTEDVEIKKLEADADKLKKIEYAKENYEDYKERIVSVLADRMAEITQSKLEELLLKNGVKEKPGYHETGNQFKRNIELTTQEVIKKDEETVKKGMRLLTEKELYGLFEKIDAGESDESKRRAVIAQLERRFGGLVGRGDSYGSIGGNSDTNNLFLRSGAPEGDTEAKMSNDLLVDAAYVETRIRFVLESFCINHGGRINITESGLPEEDREYGRMCFLRHLKADKNNFSFEKWRMFEESDMIVRSSKKLDLDPKHDPTLTDLAIKAGGIWEQVKKPYLLFGRNGVSNLDETRDIPSDLFMEYAKIKKHEKGLTDEQQRMRTQWNKGLEKYMTGHEPTNQDVVDKATKPDGTIRLDKPETMKAMIAVLQEQGHKTREVAADKATKLGEKENELYGVKRSLVEMTSWKDELEKRNRQLDDLLGRTQKESNTQHKAQESTVDLLKKEKRDAERRLTELNTEMKAKITEIVKMLEDSASDGLPVLGKGDEIKRRAKVRELLEELLK